MTVLIVSMNKGICTEAGNNDHLVVVKDDVVGNVRACQNSSRQLESNGGSII